MQLSSMADTLIDELNDVKSTEQYAEVHFRDGESGRLEVERFIKQGFEKAFNADILVSMPVVVCLKEKSKQAALGLRSNNEGLFIEQYLTTPLLTHIQKIFPLANGNQLLEIGNLYSNAKRLTISLFLTLAKVASLHHKEYLALCGTQTLLNLLTKSGVEYYDICDANPKLLDASEDDWGCYYDTNPRVVFIALSQVISLVESNPFYQRQLHRLQPSISAIHHKMEGTL